MNRGHGSSRHVDSAGVIDRAGFIHRLRRACGGISHVAAACLNSIRMGASARGCRTTQFAFALFISAKLALADGVVLDDGRAPARWTVSAADGVRAQLGAAPGTGGGLRLDVNFESGAGFCVVRRAVPMKLAANYRFGVTVRGDLPPNNFEFKLIDAAGDSVWWVNQRAYRFEKEWKAHGFLKRHFQFAWGPAQGAPLQEISAIEIAIASSTGGRGYVEIDELTYEELPVAEPLTQPEFAELGGAPPRRIAVVDERVEGLELRAGAELLIPLRGRAEIGGVMLDWEGVSEGAHVRIRTLTTADAARSAKPREIVRPLRAGKMHVPLDGAFADAIRIVVEGGGAARLSALRLLPAEFAESLNQRIDLIARDAPRGRYPRYFLGEAAAWTVAGVPGHVDEALFDTDSAVELYRQGPRIEPFIYTDRLLTWHDATATPRLEGGDLPIPSVALDFGALRLEVLPLAVGDEKHAALHVRYRLSNAQEAPQRGRLFLALRPFQVLPSYQELNITGGGARVERMHFHPESATIDARPALRFAPRPEAAGASPLSVGEIVEWLARGALPPATGVEDPEGLLSAAVQYSFELAPRQSQDYFVTVPFGTAGGADAAGLDPLTPGRFEQLLSEQTRLWQAELSRVELQLPTAGRALAETFRTVQGHILINADGPGIQPGSRSYERSWIRDGALTGTALLYTGHAARVATFLDWFGPHQFESGKVPCVVDRRGPDPVPEHDSTGQYIYALAQYFRFTQDRALLERHLPRVVAGVRYLDGLRRQRLTPEFTVGPPEKRACAGLVTESISHEGYSAKPMHSYWDSFFTLRGLRDAVAIATVLEQAELAREFSKLRDEYAAALTASLELAQKNKGIEFIPGCVELGDFDATSTAVAYFPCAVEDVIPAGPMRRTFAKYLDFFRARRDGTQPWENYTPYEVRLIGTFVRLEQRDAAHELADFFLADRRPPAWNQWAEVVWRDPRAPRFIGDMPHTWVGSDFVSAVRSLFVHEREHDAALILAAGVRPEWLDGGETVAIRRFPIEGGALSYSIKHRGDQTEIELSSAAVTAWASPSRSAQSAVARPSRGAVIVMNPRRTPILAAKHGGRAIDVLEGRYVRIPDLDGLLVLTYAAASEGDKVRK